VPLPEEPDLSDGREAVEELMTDACRIWHDAGGTLDEALDPVTGRLVRPPGNDVVVYDASSQGSESRPLEGRCRMKMRSEADPTAHPLGERQIGQRLYELNIPWDAPVPARGDYAEITFSLRDPALVGPIWKVREVLRTSFLIQRTLVMENFAELGRQA